jgi:hypothetical protein
VRRVKKNIYNKIGIKNPVDFAGPVGEQIKNGGGKVKVRSAI